jgi:phage tail-like protein
MANQLLQNFNFQVKLRRSVHQDAGLAGSSNGAPDSAPSGQPLGDGAFQECSGLDLEMDVQEYQEGGRNDGVIRRVGRAKYSPIVLKRGMFFADSSPTANQDLWRWIQGVVAGERPVPRYDGIIEIMSRGQTVGATWVFLRGLPAKITGPQLNAKTGDVAIEELHIAHEGLRLEN